MRQTYFFLQATDGMRSHCVTGVQTCALPIYLPRPRRADLQAGVLFERVDQLDEVEGVGVQVLLERCIHGHLLGLRSEERRVGKVLTFRGTWYELYQAETETMLKLKLSHVVRR